MRAPAEPEIRRSRRSLTLRRFAASQQYALETAKMDPICPTTHAATQQISRWRLRMADVLKSKSILLLLAGFGVLLAIGIVTS